jgi:hypothetical protein
LPGRERGIRAQAGEPQYSVKLVAAASSTDVLEGHRSDTVLQKRFHDLAHGRYLLVGEHIDAKLAEIRKRPSPHTADDYVGCSKGRQRAHRIEAATFVVRSVLHDGDIKDFGVVDGDESKEITMTEVARALSFEAARGERGHGDRPRVILFRFI